MASDTRARSSDGTAAGTVGGEPGGHKEGETGGDASVDGGTDVEIIGTAFDSPEKDNPIPGAPEAGTEDS